MKNISGQRVLPFLLLVSGLLHMTNAQAASQSFSVRSGDYRLDTTRQTILNRTLNFTESDTGNIAFEYQYTFDNNLSIGGEHIDMQHNYVDVGNNLTGEMSTTFLLFNLKYHVHIVDWVRPYAGVSIGGSYVDIEGTVNGDATGTATGLSLGATFPFGDHFGLALNYRKLDSEPEDSAGNKIDVSGQNLSASFVIMF